MKNTVAIVHRGQPGYRPLNCLETGPRDFSCLVLAARNGDALKEVAKAV